MLLCPGEHRGQLRDLLTNQWVEVLVTLQDHLMLLLLLVQLLQMLVLQARMVKAVRLPLVSLGPRAASASNH